MVYDVAEIFKPPGFLFSVERLALRVNYSKKIRLDII